LFFPPQKIQLLGLKQKPGNDRIIQMSQNLAHYTKKISKLKKTATAVFLSTDPCNRQQATGNRQQATGNRQQATGNYTHLIKIVSTI
jgi:hypothetical protein